MKSTCFLLLDPNNLPHGVDNNFFYKRYGTQEVWTLNDFYQFYPNIKPEVVFQIHKDFKGHQEKSRFIGNYLKEYNKSGAKIITTSHYPELTNEELLPMDEWEKEYGDELDCSLSFMFIYAIKNGYNKVCIDGTTMLHGPYNWEIPIIIKWVDRCRVLGMEFTCFMEKKWRAILPSCAHDHELNLGVYWKRP